MEWKVKFWDNILEIHKNVHTFQIFFLPDSSTTGRCWLLTIYLHNNFRFIIDVHNLTILMNYFQNVFNVEYQNNARFLYSITATRSRSTTPLNTIVMFVPQQEVRNLNYRCNHDCKFIHNFILH